MRYMFLLYHPDRPESGSPEAAELFDSVRRFHADVAQRGALVASEPLDHPGTAVTVRGGEGDGVITTDGPFAETKEWLGGYFVLECRDLDEALGLAAACPTAPGGSVEVRPVVDGPDRRGGEARPAPAGATTYMLLIHDSPAAWEALADDRREAAFAEYGVVSEAPGVIGGAQLQPASTATTVRVRDGRVLTTDGPFAETKEALGGYFLFAGTDREAAVDLAARIPAVWMGGGVEVRRVLER